MSRNSSRSKLESKRSNARRRDTTQRRRAALTRSDAQALVVAAFSPSSSRQSSSSQLPSLIAARRQSLSSSSSAASARSLARSVSVCVERAAGRRADEARMLSLYCNRHFARDTTSRFRCRRPVARALVFTIVDDFEQQNNEARSLSWRSATIAATRPKSTISLGLDVNA